LMGVPVTGNGRRESFAHVPMPRMTNTYMLNGDKDPQEIIRSVKHGLYAVNFGGGQVDITSGKFVFSASEAYMIEDGKVTYPKSPVSVSWWRSVGATHTALAMEHTIDQLAAKAGKDPVEYRRALYEKAGAQRHLAVLNLAAEKAGWGHPLEKGFARGVAVHESFNTVVANQTDPASGTWTAQIS